MLDGLPWFVIITVYFEQDLNKFIQGIRPSAVLCHLGASVELEHSPFRDMVTDICINYLGEPAATGIILYREFIILATVYYTSFCNLGEFDAVKRLREND